MKKIILSIIGIAIVLAVAYLANVRQHAADTAYAKYETCVQVEYGMSPATYYQEHGETPAC